MSGRSSRPGMDSPELAQLRNAIDRPEHGRTRARSHHAFRRAGIVAINLSNVRVNMIQKMNKAKKQNPGRPCLPGFVSRKDTAFRMPSKGRSYAANVIWRALNLNIRILSSFLKKPASRDACCTQTAPPALTAMARQDAVPDAAGSRGPSATHAPRPPSSSHCAQGSARSIDAHSSPRRCEAPSLAPAPHRSAMTLPRRPWRSAARTPAPVSAPDPDAAA